MVGKRTRTGNLATWFDSILLHLNGTKTEDMLVDLRRPRSNSEPVRINSFCVEQVQSYRNLGRSVQVGTQLYVLRWLSSFNIWNVLLLFFQSSVASDL